MRKRICGAVMVFMVLIIAVFSGDLAYLNHQVERVDFATAQGSEQANIWLFVASDSRRDAPDEQAYHDELQDQGERADIVFLVKEHGDHVDYVNLSRDILVTYSHHRERLSVMLYLGPDWLARSLCNDYQIPVNHVAIVTMQTVISVVDALGGIPVDIPYTFRDQQASADFSAGPQVLDGRQALAYVRSRHPEIYDNGEWKKADQVAGANQRMDHAQEIVQIIVDQIKQTKNPVTLHKVASAAAQNIRIDHQASVVELAQLLRKPRQFHTVETRVVSEDGLQRELTPAGEQTLQRLGMTRQCHMNPGI